MVYVIYTYMNSVWGFHVGKTWNLWVFTVYIIVILIVIICHDY